MSTHNICFYGKLTKIILQLSSITLVCSTDHNNIQSGKLRLKHKVRQIRWVFGDNSGIIFLYTWQKKLGIFGFVMLYL